MNNPITPADLPADATMLSPATNLRRTLSDLQYEVLATRHRETQKREAALARQVAELTEALHAAHAAQDVAASRALVWESGYAADGFNLLMRLDPAMLRTAHDARRSLEFAVDKCLRELWERYTARFAVPKPGMPK